jgi:ABC-type Mn2+/Zn2+ transport system permease subunit
VPDATSPNSGTKPRRWTVIAAGLLCGLLALVVIYPKPRAFRSPLAVVVLAAIGLAAVLAQLSFYNRQSAEPVHAPTWLNVLGILLAAGALFSDVLRLTPPIAQTMVLGAVLSFSISSAVILHAFRKRSTPK